jgi:hypothetical protein
MKLRCVTLKSKQRLFSGQTVFNNVFNKYWIIACADHDSDLHRQVLMDPQDLQFDEGGRYAVWINEIIVTQQTHKQPSQKAPENSNILLIRQSEFAT